MKKITETELERMDAGEIIEAYMDQEKIRDFEGCNGVRNFEKICRAMGYGRSRQFVGDWPLHNFLADNPGAIEAIMEWFGRVVRTDDESIEELKGHLNVVEDEE